MFFSQYKVPFTYKIEKYIIPKEENKTRTQTPNDLLINFLLAFTAINLIHLVKGSIKSKNLFYIFWKLGNPELQGLALEVLLGLIRTRQPTDERIVRAVQIQDAADMPNLEFELVSKLQRGRKIGNQDTLRIIGKTLFFREWIF